MSDAKPETQPRVLCQPDGIRVWRGYRSKTFVDNRTGFDEKIKSIFVPHTAQQMFPLGLQSYFPALLPDSRVMKSTDGRNDAFLILPDEIALVVYPSKQMYDQAVTSSVAGRAYSMLHWPMFSSGEAPIPKSLSGPPVPWKENWEFDEPLTLVNNAIDWQTGTTEAILLPRHFEHSDSDYRYQITECITSWLKDDHSQIDGSVLAVNPTYLLYWEHREAKLEKQSLVHKLKAFMGPPYLHNMSKVANVPPAFSEKDNGVEMAIGDVLDVRLLASAIGS